MKDDHYDLMSKDTSLGQTNTVTAQTITKGMKFDDNKLMFRLIPPEIKLWLAEILTHGAQKYAPDNWKKIEVERYWDALDRHINAYQLGEDFDKDSKMHHLKHALTNMMFITWLEIKKLENTTVKDTLRS